jgi:hypothetical protein
MLETFTAKPATAGSDTSTSVIYDRAKDPAPASLPAPTSAANASATASIMFDAYSFAVLSPSP